MNFIWAINQIKEGRKVKRNIISTRTITIMFYEDDTIKFKDCNGCIIVDSCVTIIDVEATDWKLHEEHFDLSKKAKDILTDRTGEEWSGIYYQETDIKELIKQLKEQIEEMMESNGSCLIHNQIDRIYELINNLAGERFK